MTMESTVLCEHYAASFEIIYIFETESGQPQEVMTLLAIDNWIKSTLKEQRLSRIALRL